MNVYVCMYICNHKDYQADFICMYSFRSKKERRCLVFQGLNPIKYIQKKYVNVYDA